MRAVAAAQRCLIYHPLIQSMRYRAGLAGSALQVNRNSLPIGPRYGFERTPCLMTISNRDGMNAVRAMRKRGNSA
jgi:hypothetical protein